MCSQLLPAEGSYSVWQREVVKVLRKLLNRMNGSSVHRGQDKQPQEFEQGFMRSRQPENPNGRRCRTPDPKTKSI